MKCSSGRPSTKAAIDAMKLSNSRQRRAWKHPYGLQKTPNEKPFGFGRAGRVGRRRPPPGLVPVSPGIGDNGSPGLAGLASGLLSASDGCFGDLSPAAIQ
jgi:hypothetical protein